MNTVIHEKATKSAKRWTIIHIFNAVPAILESTAFPIILMIAACAFLAIISYRILRGLFIGDYLISTCDFIVSVLLSPWEKDFGVFHNSYRMAAGVVLWCTASYFSFIASIFWKRLLYRISVIVLALWIIVFSTPRQHCSEQELLNFVNSIPLGTSATELYSLIPSRMFFKFKGLRDISETPESISCSNNSFCKRELGNNNSIQGNNNKPAKELLLSGESFSSERIGSMLFGYRSGIVARMYFTESEIFCGFITAELFIPPNKQLHDSY